MKDNGSTNGNGNGNGRGRPAPGEPGGPFKKGDPRINRNGRGKGKTGFANLLKEMGKIELKDGKTQMQAVCEKLYKLAIEGEPWAVTALMDRTDGKARQAIELLDNHRNIGGLGDEELTALFLQNALEN